MIREFLSDFATIAKPPHEHDTFDPYLSMILTIVAITVVIYGIQTLTLNIYTYAAKPVTIQTDSEQAVLCENLTKMDLFFSCKEQNRGNDQPYQSEILPSVLGAFHKSIN